MFPIAAIAPRGAENPGRVYGWPPEQNLFTAGAKGLLSRDQGFRRVPLALIANN